MSCKEIIEAITSTIEAVTVRESIVKMTSDIVAKSLQKLKSQLCDTNTTWKGNLDLTVIATAKVNIFFCPIFFSLKVKKNNYPHQKNNISDKFTLKKMFPFLEIFFKQIHYKKIFLP